MAEPAGTSAATSGPGPVVDPAAAAAATPAAAAAGPITPTNIAGRLQNGGLWDRVLNWDVLTEDLAKTAAAYKDTGCNAVGGTSHHAALQFLRLSGIDVFYGPKFVTIQMSSVVAQRLCIKLLEACTLLDPVFTQITMMTGPTTENAGTYVIDTPAKFLNYEPALMEFMHEHIQVLFQAATQFGPGAVTQPPPSPHDIQHPSALAMSAAASALHSTAQTAKLKATTDDKVLQGLRVDSRLVEEGIKRADVRPIVLAAMAEYERTILHAHHISKGDAMDEAVLAASKSIAAHHIITRDFKSPAVYEVTSVEGKPIAAFLKHLSGHITSHITAGWRTTIYNGMHSQIHAILHDFTVSHGLLINTQYCVFVLKPIHPCAIGLKRELNLRTELLVCSSWR